ncbi:MAG: molybdate ABC transporter substrate-binding protein [Ectothiorhodospiraceae bacterium]|nr:molybdate ABC transporter substrate-binding protein [Ectothiorhodospiraceae bacterium]MCH8503789.1 molybdate ABC transporter substrate-binding protein [Ectothiorhodospiraceae bacterium]
MRFFPLALLMLSLWMAGGAHATDRPIVAAASDLQYALETVAEQFRADTGHSVRLNFGSSGNFRRQIAQGAPFQLYLSADESYVDALYREGHLEDQGTLYATGRIVIMTRKGDPADPDDGSLEQLRERLAAGEIRRFAIANPEHAPYGVAARQALESAGIWDEIKPFLVYGENVSQAVRYALSSDTQGGIVAYSLALAPAIDARARYALIPEANHAPLHQRMALVAGADETARAFYHYLQDEPARDILRRYGFLTPDDGDAGPDRAAVPPEARPGTPLESVL